MNDHNELYEIVRHHPSFSSISTSPIQPTYNHIVETRKIYFKDFSEDNFTHKISYKETQTDYSEYGIANIRVFGKWETVSFEIGGSTISTIHNFAGKNTFHITDNNRCVPFSKYHVMKIRYELKDNNIFENDIAIMYDIVRVNEGSLKKMSFAYLQQEYSGTNNFSDELFTRTQCYFVHPLHKVQAYSSVPIYNVIMKFKNYKDDKEYVVPFNKVNNTTWEYVFGDKPVNAYSQYLEFNHTLSGNIDIIANSYSHMMGLSGMYGLKYSK